MGFALLRPRMLPVAGRASPEEQDGRRVDFEGRTATMEMWDTFAQAWLGYLRYLGGEILHPHPRNYFYALVLLSIVVYLLELRFPWRRYQARIRRDFWIDAFYMFWNFFLFPALVFIAASATVGRLFTELRQSAGIDTLVLFDLRQWPPIAQLAVMFVLRDFLHWNVHRMLHRVPWMWEWHKVHHSVREMGFAAHLRYHWMETVIYRLVESLPLAALGFSVSDFFAVHMLSLSIGHLNHANFRFPLGPLRYLLNNAPMHIWHHAKTMPPEHPYGMNYGISLSLWDYLFGTAYLPTDGRDLDLGFAEVESFPQDFARQLSWRPQPTDSAEA